MEIRAILFDFDGTLADTLDDIAASMNHALAAAGLPTHPRHAYRELVGEGVERLVERALPPDRLETKSAVLSELRDHYTAHMTDRTAPYPGVPGLLDGIAERGLPAAVLSNKPQAATRHLVERLFGRWTFEAVVGPAPGVPHKPDPGGALQIARRVGIEPGRWLYLGDTRTDMETATAAGMVPVGALWGFRDRAELEAHGAREVVERPSDVLDLLPD